VLEAVVQCSLDILFVKEFKELNKFINILTQKLHFLSGIAIVVMTILMTLDVIARYALNSGLPDTIEISSMLLGAVTALALPSVTGRGEHIRFSVVTDMFSTRSQGFANILTLVIAAVMFGLMAYHALMRGLSNLRTGEFMGSLQIPLWPFRMMFAFCCVLTFGVVVSQLFAHFTRKTNVDGTGV
jgi:TRAP-type C4-dicarboxylate transport system permease small subunit